MLTTADQLTHRAHHTSENFFDCRNDHPNVKVKVAVALSEARRRSRTNLFFLSFLLRFDLDPTGAD